MRKVVAFGDRSTKGDNFGGELQPMGSLRRSSAKVRKLSELRFGVVRGVGQGIGMGATRPVAKLLWAIVLTVFTRHATDRRPPEPPIHLST